MLLGKTPPVEGLPKSVSSLTPPTDDAHRGAPRKDAAELRHPSFFLNRELTWLNFNHRVLHEAEDRRNPLLERVKFLSIVGSNLDDPVKQVSSALAELDAVPQTRLVRKSSLYRTSPVGHAEQPDFVNAVALLETRLPARALLDLLLATERAFGRVRPDGERWGPRTLDLDLLLYGDAVIDEPGLRVPHPHLHERAFALLPLAEIAPDALIPGIGPVAEIAAGMAAGGIEALP